MNSPDQPSPKPDKYADNPYAEIGEKSEPVGRGQESREYKAKKGRIQRLLTAIINQHPDTQITSSQLSDEPVKRIEDLPKPQWPNTNINRPGDKIDDRDFPSRKLLYSGEYDYMLGVSRQTNQGYTRDTMDILMNNGKDDEKHFRFYGSVEGKILFNL